MVSVCNSWAFSCSADCAQAGAASAAVATVNMAAFSKWFIEQSFQPGWPRRAKSSPSWYALTCVKVSPSGTFVKSNPLQPDILRRREFRYARLTSGSRAMKSAYGRQTPPPDYELTCVEPGSPMGELLRRYWQPVCTSDELRELPRKEKLLCEEIVVFRDKKGRVGALDPHCSHRGTSLEWGRVEA